jgi:hypothetical protein
VVCLGRPFVNIASESLSRYWRPIRHFVFMAVNRSYESNDFSIAQLDTSPTIIPEAENLWREACQDYLETTGIAEGSELWSLLTQTSRVEQVLGVADQAWGKFMTPNLSASDRVLTSVKLGNRKSPSSSGWDSSQNYRLFLTHEDLSALKQKFNPRKYEKFRKGVETDLTGLDILEKASSATNTVCGSSTCTYVSWRPISPSYLEGFEFS